MANLDWSQCPAVESIPSKVSGAWVFKDTRMPVSTVFENLQDMSVEELIKEFGVIRIKSCAANLLDPLPVAFNSRSTQQPAPLCDDAP